ncbi:MAG: 1-(5-phosphoribosyl)-5-((5-phosphoribosylamino)methylideneamino)imidazole-4-carboxamide isomerase [Gammaproteobacteria bacterium]|nr:MAG: 1-(5-phosphoribosyl)-5-((5-phosphoribosylamino)methylideneamino)imidazole-4-carboxamide isomerase [Gammaproteobacteria bacterium]
MSKPVARRPTEIRHHQKSRVPAVVFGTGEHFKLTAEFLRVHSPSADVRGHSLEQAKLEVGKENVNIVEIVPVGNYAIGIHFDDGHDTGIYSWEELFHMGVYKDKLWKEYLEALEQQGHVRREPTQT